MIVIDQKLLDAMKAAERCDYCGAKIPFADPHHVDARAMGGGRRLDLRQNIARLCPTFYGNNCHHKVTIGRISKDDMLACVAKREKTTAGRLRRYLDACHNAPKEGPLPAWEESMEFSIHPVAEKFPRPDADRYAEIKKSIEKHGVLEKVKVWDMKIMDGLTRFSICKELGTECPVEHWNCSEEEAIERAISANSDRRDLTSNQRLMAVAAAYLLLEPFALARRNANLKHGKKEQPSPDCSNEQSEKTQGFSKNENPRTRDEVAKHSKVSPAKASRAIRVSKHATEEVKQAVSKDKVAVSDAAEVAKKPPEVQREALKIVESGDAKTLTEAVAKVEQTQEGVRDARGRVVPENLMPKYQAQVKLAEYLATLKKMQPQITLLEKELYATYASHPYRHQAQEHLKQCRSCLEYLMNGFVCPHCLGRGLDNDNTCPCCHNRLWFFGGAADQIEEKVWRKGA